MISIDTLRSDHLPAYGYKTGETPAITRLRSDGILYERAYSAAPTTLPAHASLLTGAPPPRHGVRDNIGYKLDDLLPTLPESLRSSGYDTAASVSAYVLRRQSGIDRGFSHFDDNLSWSGFAVMADVQRPGLESLEAVRGWLKSITDRPFFLFLHLYEPHAPYTPPEPFASRHSLAYDGEIAAADAAVGALIAELETLELYDRSLIVLTSDHGEGLGDHGENEHGVLLYRESLQVPLILKLPFSESAGETVATPVALSDVAPTLLSLLGVAVPESMEGTNLVELLHHRPTPRALYSETYYPRLRLGWSELRSVIRGDYHYIDGPDPELFDLRTDPREEVNILSRERRLARELKAELAAYDAPLQEPLEADVDARQALLSLGYLADRTSTESDEELPDPKARIDALERLDRGLAAYRYGDIAAAVEMLQGVVAENPKVVVGWEFLGRAHLRSGRIGPAYESLSTAFSLSKGAPHLAEPLARVAVAQGKLEDADVYLRLALEREPEEATLRLLHGWVLLQSRRYPEALAAAESVLASQPENPDAVYLVGSTQMGLGRLDDAEVSLRRALELAPGHTAALSDLAVLLASLQRTAEARRLAERLLALQPGDATAIDLLSGAPPGPS